MKYNFLAKWLENDTTCQAIRVKDGDFKIISKFNSKTGVKYAFPPKPYKLVCECGYSRIVVIKSDAIRGEDIKKMSDPCQKCGNTSMRREELNYFDRLKLRLQGYPAYLYDPRRK